MAVTPGFLGIDEPTVIDKRADTNVVTRAATIVHREVVSLGSADDATPESLAKIDSTGSLRTVSTDAAGTNQQAITAAGDQKVTLDGEVVTVDQAIATNLKAEVVGPSSDNSANTTTKQAVIAARANAAEPSWTEGNQVPLSVGLAGVLRTDVSRWLGSTAPTIGSKTSGNSVPVVIASDQGAVATTPAQATAANLNAQVVGDIAHDGVDSGKPVKIGGKARQTNPTAVADADRADLYVDDLGKPIVRLCAPRDLIVKQTTTISSTTETTIATAVASTFLDLVLIILINTSATAVRVDIRDTTGGSVIFAIYLPAGDTRGFSIPGTPIPQTTVNTNWTAQLASAVTDVRILTVCAKDV